MSEKRTEVIRLYFTKGEKLVIQELARRRGKKATAFVRDSLYTSFPQIFDRSLQIIVKKREEAIAMLKSGKDWDEEAYQKIRKGENDVEA